MKREAGRKISVVKVDPLTGEVLAFYESLSEAARDLKNAQIGNISRACRGKINTHKGFAWRYAQKVKRH